MISLRSRYQNLYIPSDFFNAHFSWIDAFPVHQPFALGHAAAFHVFSKEVASTEKSDAILEPSDADHLFSAKVRVCVCARARMCAFIWSGQRCSVFMLLFMICARARARVCPSERSLSVCASV